MCIRDRRHDGALYEVSPWSLSWDDENYYLIAYDSNEGIIKHFRVDKMLYIKSNGKGREGRQALKSFDMAAYAKMCIRDSFPPEKI